MFWAIRDEHILCFGRLETSIFDLVFNYNLINSGHYRIFKYVCLKFIKFFSSRTIVILVNLIIGCITNLNQ